MRSHLRTGQHLQHLSLTVRHFQGRSGCAHNPFYQATTCYFGDTPRARAPPRYCPDHLVGGADVGGDGDGAIGNPVLLLDQPDGFVLGGGVDVDRGNTRALSSESRLLARPNAPPAPATKVRLPASPFKLGPPNRGTRTVWPHFR